MNRAAVPVGVAAVAVAVWRLATVDPWIIPLSAAVVGVVAVWGVVEGRRDG